MENILSILLENAVKKRKEKINFSIERSYGISKEEKTRVCFLSDEGQPIVRVYTYIPLGDGNAED